MSSAVALDAFSQCHKYPLKGNPICVNFGFNPSSKKQPPAAASTAPAANILVRPQKAAEPARQVGKVLIQPMTSSETEGKVENLKTSSLMQKPQIADKGKTAAAKKASGTTSILSQMVKQAKAKAANEDAAEVEDKDEESDGAFFNC